MTRYIDSEKLKHILNNSKYYGKKQGNDFADMITECEAEDVVPVKHAHWIPEKLGDCECSNCHKEYGVCGGLLGDYNYCPNCGAKMDGKGK